MRISDRSSLFGALITGMVVLAASSSSAFGQSFSGTTAGQPTFARPTSLTTVAGSGTNADVIPYRAMPFTVSVGGNYTFTTNTTTYDGYLFLYSSSFNPASPLTGLLAGTDDSPTTNVSIINTTGNGNSYGTPGALSIGTQYILVQTGYSNASSGAYTGVVTGPGLATFAPVPEPATLGMVGATGLAFLARRWKRRKAGLVPA